MKRLLREPLFHFLLLGAGAASTGFADLRAAAPALPTFTRNAVFLLALLGFGSNL